MTKGKLPGRGWLLRGVESHPAPLLECRLAAYKLRRHTLPTAKFDSARERIRIAIDRYREKHRGTPPVTLTERKKRLEGVALAARRLAADPANQAWRKRLVERVAPLFLEDLGAADFANHALVSFERKLGRARGLSRFLVTLRSRKQLDEDDVGRCLALSGIAERMSAIDAENPFLPAARDPHLPGLRDPYLLELVEELEGLWVELTGRSIVAKDAVSKKVYFAEWLARVVRRATKDPQRRYRATPGAILDASRALKKSKIAARVRSVREM